MRLTISQVLRMTVSVFSPRKSIFSRPRSPTGFIAYCVTMRAVFVLLERQQIDERLVADDHARRVDARRCA